MICRTAAPDIIGIKGAAAPVGFVRTPPGRLSSEGRARPLYPAKIYDFLFACEPAAGLAVDVATGLGHAALPLLGRFERVVAVDRQPRMIACAARRPNLSYVVGSAESLPIKDGCADLVTVAQALHHLDLDRFYAEARRVLRPGGLLACWCFGGHRLPAEVDRHYRTVYEALAPFWPPGRELVVKGYAGLPFPFERLSAPVIEMRTLLRQSEFHEYLRSWTAFRSFVLSGGPDPLAGISHRVWGKPGRRHAVTWPIHLLVGRNGSRQQCLSQP